MWLQDPSRVLLILVLGFAGPLTACVDLTRPPELAACGGGACADAEGPGNWGQGGQAGQGGRGGLGGPSGAADSGGAGGATRDAPTSAFDQGPTSGAGETPPPASDLGADTTPRTSARDSLPPVDLASAEAADPRSDAPADLTAALDTPYDGASPLDLPAFDPDAAGATADTGAPDAPGPDLATPDAPWDLAPADVQSADALLAMNGALCGVNAQCQSGVCADGVCCTSACAGPCQACNLPGFAGICAPVPSGEDPASECDPEASSPCGRDGVCDGAGACRVASAGTPCGGQTCVGTTESAARTCDGLGACRLAATKDCAPYKCAGNACAAACTVDGDCQSGSFCQSMRCSGLLGLGVACTAGTQCLSGSCVDGVCCQTACAGACEACNLAGATGVCAPIPAGQDPAGECPDDGAASCKRDGWCDGSRACRQYPPGTSCGAQACSAGIESSARACDGVGTCQAASTKPCAPFMCSGVACAATCGAHTDCAPGAYCSGGACTTGLLAGLAGYWKLDDTASPALDASGNSQSGAWEGTPVFDAGQKAPTRFANGGSLRCDRAESDRVRIGRTATLEIAGAFTVSAWVRRSGSDAGWGGVLRKSWMNNTSPSFGTYGLQVPGGDWSQLAWGTGHSGSVHDIMSGVGSVADQVWVHVVGVYDPAGAAPQKRLYLNGTERASATLATPVVFDSTATGDLFLCNTGGPEYFNGHVDDVRVYARALSVAEIAALAAGQ